MYTAKNLTDSSARVFYTLAELFDFLKDCADDVYEKGGHADFIVSIDG